MSRFTQTALLLGVSLLALSACGDDEKKSEGTTAESGAATAAGTTGSSPTIASPTTASSTIAGVDTSTTTDTDLGTSGGPAEGSFSVDAANGTITLDAKPAKIISLSPTHTEMLFAIGADDQVIAVDDQSNYPAEAEAVKSDLSGFTPNVEAIAGFEPDLVVIADDSNGLGDQLAAVDIPVWSGPSAMSLDDSYSQIEQLGVLTGHVAEAAELVATMRSDIEAILAELPETEIPLTYYHEVDSTYFSATSDTFIGQVYSLVGLHNIADTADATSPYPQLSSELIVSSNPDLIFLADADFGESPETVALRDGWAGIAAVANGAVIPVKGDLASRWGPRVVEYLRAVVDAVKAASLVAPG